MMPTMRPRRRVPSAMRFASCCVMGDFRREKWRISMSEVKEPRPVLERGKTTGKPARRSGGAGMHLKTRLTEKLGIEHPILLAPMNVLAGG